jgi:tRNA(fMet)-specific endonuclease VapC
MTNSYLFDTNIISYIFRTNKPNKELIKKISEVPAEDRNINWIVVQELLFGAHKANRLDLLNLYKEFFVEINIIQSSMEIVETCADLDAFLSNNGIVIRSEDTWIAATCLTHNMTLVTNNLKHFENIPGLKVANWL